METKTKTINGREWRTTELGGEQALDIASELLKLLAPALAEAGKGYDQSKDMLDQTIDASSVINGLMKNWNTQGVKSLIKQMLSKTHVEDVRENGTVPMNAADKFDAVFSGKKLLRDLPPVLMFVFEENFGDFSQLTSFTSLIKTGQ